MPCSPSSGAVGLRKFSGRPTFPSAFTLLEVVAGLILMASVLVGSILAFSSHERQLSVADKRIAAVSLADDLLSQLTIGEQKLGAPMRGAIPDRPNWIWQTSFVGTTSPMGVPLQVIRFEVVEFRADGTSRALTSVDLVESL